MYADTAGGKLPLRWVIAIYVHCTAIIVFVCILVFNVPILYHYCVFVYTSV